jgi:hypothetical protein
MVSKPRMKILSLKSTDGAVIQQHKKSALFTIPPTAIWTTADGADNVEMALSHKKPIPPSRRNADGATADGAETIPAWRKADGATADGAESIPAWRKADGATADGAETIPAQRKADGATADGADKRQYQTGDKNAVVTISTATNYQDPTYSAEELAARWASRTPAQMAQTSKKWQDTQFRFLFLGTLSPTDREETFAKKIKPELSILSIRRGGLQRMALLGVSTECLLAHSRHKRRETLERYLDWGRLFLNPAKELLSASEEQEKQGFLLVRAHEMHLPLTFSAAFHSSLLKKNYETEFDVLQLSCTSPGP